MTGDQPQHGPDEPDLDQISPIAQDYLKVIWSATEWGEPPITSTALAARFKSSVANVTDTVKRLTALGLVTHQPYKPVYLTAAGTRYAVAMVRRHRLLETFLVDHLGYGWHEVHDEAERLEHAATATLIDRIDRLLGHPTSDPHGDPIPDPDGTTHKPRDTVTLAEAGNGTWTVVRVSDADPNLLIRARDLGLTPGRTTTIDQSTALGHTLRAAIWVTPARSGC